MRRTRTGLARSNSSKTKGFWPGSFVAAVAMVGLSACTNLPNTGPRSDAFDDAKWRYDGPANEEDAEKANLPFVLVDVDRNVIDTLASAGDASYFKGSFSDRSPPADLPLGVGDVVRVTIFEAGPGGLFNPSGAALTGGNSVTLPDQEVDQTGHISVPYTGRESETGLIKVAGRKTSHVQHDIQKRLMNKAIEPQVMVTLVKRTSNLFSVMGDVGAPGRFTLEQGGMRILDALSVAGGPKSSDYNTLITLQRGTKSATARLSTIMAQSDNNIFVQPGDLIAVKKDERFYNMLGATANNNRVAFESEIVTVADALAKAGGLNPDIAEPESVVVFRREDAKTLETAGVKLEEASSSSELIPTVYRFNLTDPSGMFHAQKMELRNNDVVYVSKSAFNDLTKLAGLLRDLLVIKLIND